MRTAPLRSACLWWLWWSCVTLTSSSLVAVGTEEEEAVDGSPQTEGSVSSCLLRCKDEHMLKFQMDSEWSMDFAFPLLSLLRTNGSVMAATEKARRLCESNGLLDACLAACPATLERRIMRFGLEPWTQLCDQFDVLVTQFDCWKANIEQLTLGCYLESHKLRMSMQTLTHNNSLLVVDSVCRDSNVLSICSIEEYTKSCGHVTKMLLVRLFQSSRNSVTEMLKIKWPVLPESCSQRIEYYHEEEQQLSLSVATGSATATVTFSFLLAQYFQRLTRF